MSWEISGETDKATIFDSIGQGSMGTALVSSLTIGVAIIWKI